MSPTLSFSLIFMFIFYFMLRYILKRFKGYKLPILFERYHDDPFKPFFTTIDFNSRLFHRIHNI